MFEISNAEAGITTNEKLKILADAAKYDVACTSSGVDRRGKKGFLGNSAACGIGRRSFSPLYWAALSPIS